MARQTGQTGSGGRRKFSAEFKREAVQMMLDGHSAVSIARNLGMKNANLLYRWKAEAHSRSGPEAQVLDSQVNQLREELLRTLGHLTGRAIFSERKREKGHALFGAQSCGCGGWLRRGGGGKLDLRGAFAGVAAGWVADFSLAVSPRCGTGAIGGAKR